MAQERKSHLGIVRAAIFILLEIAALAMLKSSSSIQNIWINRASRRMQALFWGGGEDVRNFFSLKKTNEELAQENFLLTRELMRYRSNAASAEENSLPTGTPGFSFTPATVVKMSRNSAHNYIIIDKGSADGIKENSGIITEKGVVGFVGAVSKHYSYGITLMNTNASVSSRIGNTGITGSLVWDGRHTNKGFLKDIHMHHINTPGDTVRTSGFSSIFPPGIPLGTTEEAFISDGSSFQISVNLFMDFSSLRYVTVVKNLDRAEIEELSHSGEGTR